MEQKINIAELLKDCPKGMELDCPLFEGLEFDSIVDNEFLPIRCRVKIPNRGYTVYNFTKYGCWLDTTFAKCVIFPKGKTTWEGFAPPCKFKDGDVVVTTLGSIAIISNKSDNKSYHTYCGLFGFDDFGVNVNVCPERLAIEEEKQKLFRAIKDNGYKWNAETKSLEKLVEPKFKIGDIIVNGKTTIKIGYIDDEYYYEIGRNIANRLYIKNQDNWKLFNEPKFKVGDIVQDEDGYKVKITEVNLEDECYGYESIIAKGIGGIAFSEQDNWELINEPKFKVGDRIRLKENHTYIYTITGIREKENKYECGVTFVLRFSEHDNWELVPNKFDINTLKPFDKVLVRQSANGKWGIDFFDSYTEGFYYTTGSSMYVQCIPYESNQHLRGTTNDCDEFYKTWK